jgi:hypothetical protein
MRNMNIGEAARYLGAVDRADYVNARLLAANTAEQISVPTNAKYVNLYCTHATYVAYGTNPTAVIPSDTDDGTSNEGLQIGNNWRHLDSDAKLSVISATVNAIVTASFYMA